MYSAVAALSALCLPLVRDRPGNAANPRHQDAPMRPLRNEGRGRTPATQGSRRTESVALGAHNEGRSGTRQLPCRRPAGLHRATRPRNEGRGGTRQRSEHRMPRPGDLLRHATRAGGEPPATPSEGVPWIVIPWFAQRGPGADPGNAPWDHRQVHGGGPRATRAGPNPGNASDGFRGYLLDALRAARAGAGLRQRLPRFPRPIR